jgi:polyhydroxyalkanoate synthesis regulator phasin
MPRLSRLREKKFPYRLIRKDKIMFDVVKQAAFAGIGLASLTREKAEQLAAEVARRAKLSEHETKEFQAELACRAEQARKELEAEIDRRIDHALIQLGLLKAGVKKEAAAADRELRAAFDKLVEQAIERLGVARADDLEAVSIRLQALERNLTGSPS